MPERLLVGGCGLKEITDAGEILSMVEAMLAENPVRWKCTKTYAALVSLPYLRRVAPMVDTRFFISMLLWTAMFARSVRSKRWVVPLRRKGVAGNDGLD